MPAGASATVLPDVLPDTAGAAVGALVALGGTVVDVAGRLVAVGGMSVIVGVAVSLTTVGRIVGANVGAMATTTPELFAPMGSKPTSVGSARVGSNCGGNPAGVPHPLNRINAQKVTQSVTGRKV